MSPKESESIQALRTWCDTREGYAVLEQVSKAAGATAMSSERLQRYVARRWLRLGCVALGIEFKPRWSMKL